MTPDQCRLARAALRWSIRDLARHANMTPNTISAFENDKPVRATTIDKLFEILVAYGAAFDPVTGAVHLRKIEKTG